MRAIAHTLALAACATPAPAQPCPAADVYVDARAAVEALGARLDDHVVVRPTDGEPGGYEAHGRRVIVLPVGYMARVEAGYGRAAAVAVVAHELAHLPSVARARDPERSPEAYADAVAGCALARLALPVDGYVSLVRSVGRDGDEAQRGWALCERRWR